ncbi:hypothetical protein [Kitasatospora indigofera]|uniref:hypothetical protein n=1 Tax=Kitasatospora indigofera TaxID=67307 RepID=UPI00369CE94B
MTLATSSHARYLRATGHRATCPPDRAARKIDALRRAGMTDQQIRAAAHCGRATYYRAAARRGPIMRTTEQRILAVTVLEVQPPATTASVPPHGTRRRLQALVVAGWPPAVLAGALGISLQKVHELLHRERDGVSIRMAVRVEGLFGRLWSEQPERHGVKPAAAARARLLAERWQWVPALAWDDLDDPFAAPQLGDTSGRGDAVVEDTAELIREGLSREGIAMRLCIGWDAVRQAHRRAGVPLPEVRE